MNKNRFIYIFKEEWYESRKKESMVLKMVGERYKKFICYIYIRPASTSSSSRKSFSLDAGCVYISNLLYKSMQDESLNFHSLSLSLSVFISIRHPTAISLQSAVSTSIYILLTFTRYIHVLYIYMYVCDHVRV